MEWLTKLISLIMAAFTALFSLFTAAFGIGGQTAADAVTKGAWLTEVNEQLGLTAIVDEESGKDTLATPYLPFITVDDPYYEAVQIAYEWGIITAADGEFATSDPASAQFIAVTLLRVAEYMGILGEDSFVSGLLATDAKTAVKLGLVAGNSLGNLPATYTKSQVMSFLANLADKANSYDFGTPTYTADYKEGAAPGLLAKGIEVDEEAAVGTVAQEAADIFDAVSFSGTFEPNFQLSTITDENGVVLNDPSVAPATADDVIHEFTEAEIVEQGFSLDDLKNFDLKNFDYMALLKKINFSFDIDVGNGQKLKLKVQVLDDGFVLGIGGYVIPELYINKQYELSNFKVNANLTAENFKSLDGFKQSYLRLDYDMKDTTTIVGSYAATLAETPTDDPITVAERMAAGLYQMVSGNHTIPLFSVEVPIPGIAVLTISMQLGLKISVNGSIELVIETSEAKGYQFVDGKFRIINERDTHMQSLEIDAQLEAVLSLMLGIRAMGVMLIDVTFEGGFGFEIKGTVYVKKDDGTPLNKIDLLANTPIGIVLETTLGANNEYIHGCCDVLIYGILRISIGQDSLIGKIPGVGKTFDIYGKSNGTIGHWHFEDMLQVPACTRA